jgi:DNA helicase-2/ATP-dependent DNA helicase PcrA
LTKGLEFDNVVILNAQDFNDPKHLYVALTRCCKRLVVITDNPFLHPYAI